jgi:hypothetical protein
MKTERDILCPIYAVIGRDLAIRVLCRLHSLGAEGKVIEGLIHSALMPRPTDAIHGQACNCKQDSACHDQPDPRPQKMREFAHA